MALTTTPLNNPIGAAIVTQTVCNATPNDDVRAGASTVYQVDIDNTANGAATFVKFYDNAAPSVGTTAPDYIFRVPASVRKVFTLDLSGIAFATALSFAAVTAGGTAGTSNPSSNCAVRILCT